MMRKTLSLLFLFCFCVATSALAQDAPIIRMVVSDKVRDSSIDITGPFFVQSAQSEILLKGNDLVRARIVSEQGGIRVGDNRISNDKIYVSAPNGSIMIGDKSFGPRLEIRTNKADQLTLVSLMDLEEYTSGVMEKEMDPKWPLEVLKAQAVLARTNAVYAYIRNRGKAFHLTRYSPQVYEHIPNVRLSTQAAVEETRGLILMYNDEVIPAYFHSVCGGSTEVAKNVWPQSFPYPAAVSCSLCKAAPKFRWNYHISSEEFQDKLAGSGLPVQEIYDVYASKVSAVSDRVTEVIVEHGGGKTILRTNTLRSILGHNNIRSTNFTVESRNGDLVFQGRGWGHGVGLCQWGARAMAMAGKDFEEIIKFYYPGVKILRVRD